MGAGKTALANALSRYTAWPVYRAFRAAGDGHQPGADARVKMLKNIGLPVNSWQEDMFIADMAAACRPNLILDRSLPSALTWNAAAFTLRESTAALDLWAERIGTAGAVLVLVEASEALRKARTPRWLGGEAESIAKYIAVAAARSGIELVRINTDETDIKTGVVRVCNAIRRSHPP